MGVVNLHAEKDAIFINQALTLTNVTDVTSVTSRFLLVPANIILELLLIDMLFHGIGRYGSVTDSNKRKRDVTNVTDVTRSFLRVRHKPVKDATYD